MIPFIDIHTHQAVLQSEVISVTNLFLQDFHPEIAHPFSAGIHPWHADRFESPEIERMLQVVSTHPQLVAFGETGLDKRCQADWNKQQISFQLHLKFAEKIGKPLIIHCVKAWDELLAITSGTKAILILHGYTGNRELTKQLINKGFRFSVGNAILSEKSRICQAVSDIPSSALFCETDECETDITTIYRRVAQLRSEKVDTLKEEIFRNYTCL